ncbi:MAG: AbrB/MazE/SpoVT family DNA-binding domain-containing protein [Oscillospiraceae bacterium]|nr:AbrB/MazE/SpoVT family DNA-binding domain-containing protein [Oscillospiraceae bacterium]
MKSTGIVRRVDELGRVVLPIELRRTLEIEERDQLEIMLEDDRIVLRKYQPTCVFCGAEADLLEYRGKRICGKCLKEINEQED